MKIISVCKASGGSRNHEASGGRMRLLQAYSIHKKARGKLFFTSKMVRYTSSSSHQFRILKLRSTTCQPSLLRIRVINVKPFENLPHSYLQVNTHQIGTHSIFIFLITQSVPPPLSWGHHPELANMHWAFDLGARETTFALGNHFAAPILSAQVSRLVIDYNRPLDSDTLFRVRCDHHRVHFNINLTECMSTKKVTCLANLFIS